MKKALLILCICFTPTALATERDMADIDISLSTTSSRTKVKLSAQNYSIKDLSDFHSLSMYSSPLSTLSLHKTWANDSEWKLYSSHFISSPILLKQASYSSPRLALGQSARGFSVNNRLSLRKRYSNALILTPTIGLNMLSTNGHSSNSTSLAFYPLPIQVQNQNENLYSFNTGIDLNGLFNENWGYTADLEYAYLANTNGSHAWKSEALVFYQWQDNSRVLIGYKYINGLSNEQRNVQLRPVIDVLWSW